MNRFLNCILKAIGTLGFIGALSLSPAAASHDDPARDVVDLQYQLADTCINLDRKISRARSQSDAAFFNQRYQRYCKARFFQRDLIEDICGGYRAAGTRMCARPSRYRNPAPNWRHLFKVLAEAQRVNHEFNMAMQEHAFQRALNPYGYNPYGRNGIYISPGYN